jgi:hypothetical protein
MSKGIQQSVNFAVSKIVSLEKMNLDIAFEIGISFFNANLINIYRNYFQQFLSQTNNYHFKGKDKEVFQLMPPASLLDLQQLLSFSTKKKHKHEKQSKNKTTDGEKIIPEGKSSEEISYYQLLSNLFSLQALHLEEKRPKKKTIVSDGTELNNLIKSGKFGPDIEDFSMPLPNNFPTRAGLARHALQDNIDIYDKYLQKMKVQALPKTLEEVYVPTYSERMNTFYEKMLGVKERIYQKNLKNLLKPFMKLKYFQDHSYLVRRRTTYLSLPGLSNHYPNPHYPVPAIILKEHEFKVAKKVLYNTKLEDVKNPLKSVIVSKVGRKPSPEQMIEIQNNFYTNKITNFDTLFVPNHRAEYKTDILDNLVRAQSLTKPKCELIFFYFLRFLLI